MDCMNDYILALDQGTTSSRAILYNADAQPLLSCNKEFTQYYPQPGWVEHDAEELFECQLAGIVYFLYSPIATLLSITRSMNSHNSSEKSFINAFFFMICAFERLFVTMF